MIIILIIISIIVYYNFLYKKVENLKLTTTYNSDWDDKTNCYAYSYNDLEYRPWMQEQPGAFSNPPDNSGNTCSDYIRRILKDDPQTIQINCDQSCPNGYRKIFLASDPDNIDYHFYRSDNLTDGTEHWSHKPGKLDVRYLDYGVKPWNIERKGYTHNYKDSCGCFCIIMDNSLEP